MNRVAQAEQMFRDGYGCAQCVLAVYGPAHGLDRTTAMRIAAPFVGGISRTDSVCGAVSGALVVLGAARGHSNRDDETGATRIRELTQGFLRRYRERLGSTGCTDILGHDLSQPGVAERVEAEELSLEPCPGAVRAAAEILEELLQERAQ